MKALFFIFLGIVALAGCSSKATDITPSANDTSKVKGSYQYLALGDSYTIGETLGSTQNFPYQLKLALYPIGFYVTDPQIIAVTGWTTTDLINGIQQAHIMRSYDFVTLLIGVNNQYQGMSQSDYRTQFVQLLNEAIGFANGNKLRVFVLSIPDYSVTPFASGLDKATIATQIDLFNAINKDESTRAGVNYLDITGISRTAATDPTLVAVDGLHPSAKMYGLWVAQLAPMVAAQLNK